MLLLMAIDYWDCSFSVKISWCYIQSRYTCCSFTLNWNGGCWSWYTSGRTMKVTMSCNPLCNATTWLATTFVRHGLFHHTGFTVCTKRKLLEVLVTWCPITGPLSNRGMASKRSQNESEIKKSLKTNDFPTLPPRMICTSTLPGLGSLCICWW